MSPAKISHTNDQAVPTCREHMGDTLHAASLPCDAGGGRCGRAVVIAASLVLDGGGATVATALVVVQPPNGPIGLAAGGLVSVNETTWRDGDGAAVRST